MMAILMRKSLNKREVRVEKREGIDASAAIDKIVEGPSRLECTSGTYVYYTFALKEMIGKEKFDQLFGSKESSPLIEPFTISRWSDVNSIEFLWRAQN
ncbi:MAG: hypothetical protein HWD61_08335 [Parachlamydiaceae bacterium]|nr:MAG: hypothetical protein HWD61_08335 [Parachlamydiaceae bacterium]